jgi:superfamily II DNA or RNA helicase
MPRLHPFQQVGVEALKRAPRHRWINNYEMGLGKSPVTIKFLEAINAEKVLIVCPAIVRSHWRDEFARWWSPDLGVGCITAGRSRKMASKKSTGIRDGSYRSPIQVVSYALLKHVDPEGWQAIVIDELHRCKAPNSQQTEAVRAIVEANPQAAVIGNTGTLMPDTIEDIWAPLDIMWPGRFGVQTKRGSVPYKFAARYQLEEKVEFRTREGLQVRTKFAGLNPEYKDELAYRLSCISTRVTKAEVAHLLPPFQVRLLKVGSDRQVRFNTLTEWESSNGTTKIPDALEWLENSQATHVCIATHLRETARAIAARIPHAVLVTGDCSPEERNGLLAQAKASPSAVVVCTYHSVGIGIDLTFCAEALIVELFPRPETMLQFLGRFSRLSGKVPSSVDILCFEDTVDQRMAEILMEKVARINEAIPPGVSDVKLSDALGSVRETDEVKLQEQLAAAMEGIDL